MFNFVNMDTLNLEKFISEEAYLTQKYSGIKGRHLHAGHLKKFLNCLDDSFQKIEIGNSVEKESIFRIQFGEGNIKILAWSQMHGNEATTTKAVFDLFNFFNLEPKNKLVEFLKKSIIIYVIPILNPDGAKNYTRFNANKIDLNRDLQELSQPESVILKEQYHKIQPDFCLNLHDQRTIFSAGDKKEPATLSFLTPSRNEERSIDESRKASMGLIASINAELQKWIPGKVGRYDDAFNINCAGDTFQSLNTPTILFEAGHFPKDYSREETRKYVFKAIITCLFKIAQNSDLKKDYKKYFEIPENAKLFNDILIRNYELKGKRKDISIQFREELKNNQIKFVPVIDSIENDLLKYGHLEINAETDNVQIITEDKIIENVIVNKIVINSEDLDLFPAELSN
ncbi:M14 family zinc carboxypeptidase [Christiangramia antarctica]|uniref:M14 family zinc carboxypeptidase n=2 Tax=Flavobacteriaceae TaxID=49546 RepID=A0ABW5X9C8_9FLAO